MSAGMASALGAGVAAVEVHLGSGARLSELPAGSVPLVLTSPPYFPDAIETRLREGRLDPARMAAFRAETEVFALSLRSVFRACERVLRPGGHLVVQTRDVRLGDALLPVESIHRQMIEALGLRLLTRHLWRPAFQTHGRRQLAASRVREGLPMPFDPEVFLVFEKSGPRHRGELSEADLELLQADIIVSGKGHLPAAHRFQAPIPVLEALIRTWTAPGDWVVDPFMGGGTTLVVAQALGRLAWGWEIDREAFVLALRNLGLSERVPECMPETVAHHD
jgi:DNA modification methylase